MYTRRKFIRSTLVTGTALASLPLLNCMEDGGHRLETIGFISGILKNELQGDWRAALKQAVALGFREYEGSIYGESADEFLRYCRDIGLKLVAGGITFTTDSNKLQVEFDRLNALEMPYAVTYWPWLVGAPFSLDDCKRSAEMLNQIGTVAKQHGLTLCWHNHDNEFKQMEEGQPFHYLMAHTEASLVKCEMDIYWVKKGGADPLAMLKQYDGRIPILHVKDMADDGDFACPGSGIIDFPAVFAEAYRQKIQHYFVERDNVPDGMACLASASEYLNGLRF